MARPDGGSASDLREMLLEKGNRFSFIQAVRLLRGLLQQEGREPLGEEILQRRIRTRPELSLVFPNTDLSSIQEISEDPRRFLITATFMGLYGSSSPLPTFYTEDLLQEQAEDRSGSRGFIDLLHHPLYWLFFQIWGRYRLFYKVAEERDPAVLEKLYSFLGLGGEELRAQVPGAFGLLRYIGLTTLFPRSAEGLGVMLADALGEVRVRIRQCVERVVEIPPAQRLVLGVSGNRLGEDAHLGENLTERMGKFRVRVGPVDAETLHRTLPDTEPFARMRKVIGFYLDQPLAWDMQIALKAEEAESACLGGERWSRLGWNTWLVAGEAQPGELVATLAGS
jgi:type VI secretion system protein ImpH